MRFSAACTLFLTSLVTARPDYGGEGKVTVSDLKLHKVAVPVGFTIQNLSFKLSGVKDKNIECSAAEPPWPEVSFMPCSNPQYSFALLPRDESPEILLMIYHDVGDRRADLRGGIVLNLHCRRRGDEPVDDECTQDRALTFRIDGPVADYRWRDAYDELR
ncbi:unnamed protein product [Clonostachys rhizophaga]|uniref:AA1-like domain-containing protein n=1 Tax=Clonostachys rhizophaga TaxID=160324 RepID=A0A9N9V6N9_9HYPO|nr:unnamed protein product [Clonostachys rhizophaga]